MTLAGVLAAAVIGGGAGVAYATGGSGAIVETGYATEVERVRGAEAAADATQVAVPFDKLRAQTADRDCSPSIPETTLDGEL